MSLDLSQHPNVAAVLLAEIGITTEQQLKELLAERRGEPDEVNYLLRLIRDGQIRYIDQRGLWVHREIAYRSDLGSIRQMKDHYGGRVVRVSIWRKEKKNA